MQLHEIAQRLNQDPIAVCTALGLPGKKKGNEYRVDIHTGKVIIVLKGNKQGLALFTGGTLNGKQGGNMLTLAIETHGDNKQGVRWAKSYLGITDDYKPDPEREAEINRQIEERKKQDQIEYEKQRLKRLNSAKYNWDKGTPIEGTPAEKYLMNRGIPKMQWPDVLRYNPECWHNIVGRKAPALMCLVTDHKNEMLGLKNIFITEDGKKGNFEDCKPTMGYVTGGAVRLFPHEGKIGLAEGVETAFGAYHLSGGKMPVWSALSTAGITGFKPPWMIDQIILYPDGDKPIYKRDGRYVGAGELACLRAQDNQEITTHIMPVPSIGMDYLDIWNAGN